MPILRLSGFATANNPYGAIQFYNTDGSQQGPNIAASIKALAHNGDGSGGKLTFATSVGTGTEGAEAVERVRIDENGNVGIGTTSPNGKLDITGSGNTDIYLNTGNDSGDNNRIFFGDTADIDTGYLSYDHGTNSMTFGVNGTVERMRIDSSGNVLVGKTATAFGTAGTVIKQTTGVTITRSAGDPLALNRLSTDGEIIGLYKDGTTVGSIGSSGTGVYIDGGSAATGLRFADGGSIIPRRANADADTNVDLGAGANRFRNILLSGGIYLGGIGSANYLDDYEEGSFTPILTDDSGRAGTHSIQVGRYVKVGKLVHIQGRVELSSLASMSGLVNLTGFPFANINVTDAYSSVNVSFADGLAITAGENLSATIVPNTTNAQMRLWDDAAGTTSLTTGELSSNGGFIFAATYRST